MATVHKKHEEPASNAADAKKAASAESSGEPTPVIVSDTVTETTERIEVIEEATPEAKSEAKKPSFAKASAGKAEDPLTDFKEKMSEEEEVPVSSKPPKKNYMWPILFIFIIALALLGGIFVYKQSMNKGADVNVVTLSPTPTVVPSPTIALDLSKYPVEILNGSGVDGEAGKQKTNLEAEGFTVSSVGNADNSDYTETIIQAKETVDQAFLDKLKSILEKSFVVGETEELSEDEDSDVIVIIGSETN